MKLRLEFLLIFLAASALYAQTTGATGAIGGAVIDPSDARIPAVAVVATELGQQTSRETATDELGEYRLPLLRPGVYRLEFMKEGFESSVANEVVVRVGETATLDVMLSVGSRTQVVEVTADAAQVDTERTQQASYIGSESIENLPINRRNFLDFALISPGVVETDTLVDDQDFRVAQTPQSGLSFGTGNGRGNMFSMDGVEHYSNSGGVRPSVTQSAVQEFQLNRSNYTAEIGGAGGGAVNIVTKSGSNEISTELFGLVRDRSLQARNYFDPFKSAYTRGQYGVVSGGPIQRNRSFWFAGYERLDRHETTFVPILQDRSAFNSLTDSQQELTDFFAASPIGTLNTFAGLISDTLIPANNPDVEKIFEENSGVFPVGGGVNMAMVRLDLSSSPKRTLFARGSHARDFSDNTDFGSLIGFSRGRSIKMVDNTWAVGQTYVFSPRWISDTRAQYAWGRIDVVPVDSFGPEINITGFGAFGRDIFLPSNTVEQHWQFRQDFIFASSDNTLKFGMDVNPVRDRVFAETFFSGRFTFGPDIPLSSLFAAATGDPLLRQKIATLLDLAGGRRLIPNLDDPLNALQAYSVGAPIFYQQGFGDPNWIGWSRRVAGYLHDELNVTPRLKLSLGLRYDLEGNKKPVPTDPNNFGPRFGFAWSPDDKLVIRGGYGLFYGQINAQVANIADTLSGSQINQVFVPLTGAPGVINPMTGKALTSADIYSTLLEQGVIGQRSITIDDIKQFGLTPAPGANGRVEFGIVDEFSNPSSQQASFEIERSVGDLAISASYVFSRGAFITRTRDHNIYQAGTTEQGVPEFGFFDPSVLQRNIFESTANSFYHAGTLSLNKRAGRRLFINAHYTWSKSIDEVTDFNSDFQPHNQLNARAERGLSPFHQGQRFVASGVWNSGVTAIKGQSLWHKVIADATFSPIIVVSSFRPFNILTGYDNLGDNHPTTHRPIGAGRNIGKGPGSATVDFRLSKELQLGGERGVRATVTGEVFNALNHTNFGKVNNVVGRAELADLPNPLTGQRGSPTEPLSFTSAMSPRQVQLGLKLQF